MKLKCPAWVHDAVFYEIYPQTFYDSNDDGIGDIPGIICKLDYVKSLGVSAIWLNPCFVSPFRDAGYDIADYYTVAPRYGTNSDLKKLFKEAAARDLRVILDFVPGHTSIDHPWFKQSCSPMPNKYSNWYAWTNSTWDKGSDEFKGSMIHGFCERDGNFLTNFFWSQPALNFGFGKPDRAQKWQLPVNHPDVLALRKEMKNILRFWLDMGASGFRVDMAGSLIRRDPGGRECSKLWREVRAMIDKDYPDAFLVSEWSCPPAALKGGFHADFLHWVKEYSDLLRKEKGKSFFDKKGKGSIAAFIKMYCEHLARTKRLGYISIPVGNHDLSRINAGRSQEELEIIFAFLLTMPGVPFIYYGDEIGMRQLDGLPFKEGCYAPRAGARTPMQWTAGENRGFSKAPPKQLWLPVDTSAGAPNASAQENNRGSLLNHVRALIALRRTEKSLMAYADFVPVYVKKNGYPFVYLRQNGASRVLIALNPSRAPVSVNVRLPVLSRANEVLAENGASLSINGNSATLDMRGCSYGIFRIAHH